MKIVLLTFLTFFFFISSKADRLSERHKKTDIGNALYNFEIYKSYNEYAENYRSYIKNLRPAASKEEIENLAPYSVIKKSSSCQQVKGFLFLHGLTDSPFIMSDFLHDITANMDCIMIISLILPGHSLIPGALLEVDEKTWIKATDFALKMFKNEGINNIVATGFSTGGSLLIDQIVKGEESIKFLILFSPAIDINMQWYKVVGANIMNLAGKFFNRFAYLKFYEDINPYKYESLAYKAALSVNALTALNRKNMKKEITFPPIFAAFSHSDTTVKSQSTIQMLKRFQENFTNIKGIIYSNNEQNILKGFKIFNPLNKSEKIIDLSHISIQVSPSNSTYGRNAKVNYGCLHYDNSKQKETFEICKRKEKDVFYGETSSSNLKIYKPLARINYNPYYNDLIKDIRHALSSNS